MGCQGDGIRRLDCGLYVRDTDEFDWFSRENYVYTRRKDVHAVFGLGLVFVILVFEVLANIVRKLQAPPLRAGEEADPVIEFEGVRRPVVLKNVIGLSDRCELVQLR